MLGAVAHAIANATGVWIKDLPITPEKIVNALKQKKAADAARRELQAEQPVTAK